MNVKTLKNRFTCTKFFCRFESIKTRILYIETIVLSLRLNFENASLLWKHPVRACMLAQPERTARTYIARQTRGRETARGEDRW